MVLNLNVILLFSIWITHLSVDWLKCYILPLVAVYECKDIFEIWEIKSLTKINKTYIKIDIENPFESLNVPMRYISTNSKACFL